jgi:rubrerythrin
MTITQYVVATHNLNRTNDAIKVSSETWMASAPAAFPRVHVCIQCGYTGDFTHIYNGAHPECPMCEGE